MSERLITAPIDNREPTECETCRGTGIEHFSDCCGAEVLNTGSRYYCADCKQNCWNESDKCGVCCGRKFLPPSNQLSDIIEGFNDEVKLNTKRYGLE